MNPIARYLELRDRMDELSARLTALHGENITCREGCTACCVNFTVFPVEFHAILSEMERDGVKPESIPFDTTATCGFLHEGLCRIYRYRPIICRTHGLPILYLDDEGDAPEWRVSFCELNFTGEGSVEFTDETLLDIEEMNAELYHINREFVASLHEKNYHENARIALKDICQKPEER
ncbi:MAG TPA: YkgJ family cysteine cluster protein [bacterium]|nr:YkgJ family cysteine cluster protein [bacterium]